MKKTLALLTSAALIAGFIPATASAELKEATLNQNSELQTLNDVLPELTKDQVQHRKAKFNDNEEISLFSDDGSIRHGNLNNVVVNIKFKGEGDFLKDDFKGKNVHDVLESMYNTSNISLNEFYKEVSFGDLNVTTDIIGSKDNNELSVELDHDRNYYFPYDPVKNKEGYFSEVLIDKNEKFVANVYDSSESGIVDTDPSDNIVSKEYLDTLGEGYQIINHIQDMYREEQMIYELSHKLNLDKLAGQNLDLNADGQVDAITFIVGAEASNPLDNIDWADMLWPHQVGMDHLTTDEAQEASDTYGLDLNFLTNPCTINGKIVDNHNLYTSTFLLDDYYVVPSNEGDLGRVGVVCHEFGHSLGFPDYYSYLDQNLSPVGRWDLMESTGLIPQYINSELRQKAGWLSNDQIKEITSDGEYELLPVTSIGTTDTSAYIINIPGYENQHFLLEYRKAEGSFDGATYGVEGITRDGLKNVYQSGLVLYRVDEGVPARESDLIMPGNFYAPPYNLFAFRVGGDEYDLKSLLYSALDGKNIMSFGSINKNSIENALTIQKVDNYSHPTSIEKVNSRVVINNVSIDDSTNKIKFTVDAKDPTVNNVENTDNKIIVTFDEKVAAGSNFSEIKLLANNKEQAINTSISDKTLEITLKNGELKGNYKLQIPQTAIVDTVGKTMAENFAQDIVVGPKAVPVTSVALDKNEVSLTVGESTKLSATVAPEDATNKEVTWTSSDESVAKVDSEGKVTAVTAGEAKVTVKTTDGNFEAACVVKVKEAEVAATKVELDKISATVKEGEELQLTGKVLPDNATDKTLTWTSSDESIATVDANGKVKALKAGKVVIKATSTTDGVYAECNVTVEAKGNAGTTPTTGGTTTTTGTSTGTTPKVTGNKIVTSGKGKGALPSTGAAIPTSVFGLISVLGGAIVYKKKNKR